MNGKDGFERGVMKALGHLAVHSLGLTFVGVSLALLLVGKGHLVWMVEMTSTFGREDFFFREVLMHLGITACVWATIYLLGLAAMERRANPKRLVARARGNVMTETIIIFPIFLTLVLGLAQLSVLNMASMLVNYGSNQAGRTVWLWQPEVNPLNNESARRGVSDSLVEDMARIQVAAAVVPVAPGEYTAEPVGATDQFRMMRATLMAHQMIAPPNDAGRAMLGPAANAADFPSAERLSVMRAMDTLPYPERTARKFTFAYAAIDITVITGEEVGVDLTYHQKIAFPWAGLIFGSPGEVGGFSGIYTALNRRVTYPAQVPPNAEMPIQ